METSDGKRFFLFVNNKAKEANEDIDILVNHVISLDLKTYLTDEEIDSHTNFWHWFYNEYSAGYYKCCDTLIDKYNIKVDIAIVTEQYLIKHMKDIPEMFESAQKLVKINEMSYMDDGLYNAVNNFSKS